MTCYDRVLMCIVGSRAQIWVGDLFSWYGDPRFSPWRILRELLRP